MSPAVQTSNLLLVDFDAATDEEMLQIINSSAKSYFSLFEILLTKPHQLCVSYEKLFIEAQFYFAAIMTASNSPDLTEQEIQKVVDDYVKNVPQLLDKLVHAPPGSVHIGSWQVGQQEYLLIRKFDFLKLPIKILRRLPVHLIREFVVEFELDSLWYWALTNDVFESSFGLRVFDKWPLKQAFQTLMAANFASLAVNPHNPALFRLNQAVDKAITEAVKNLVFNKQTVLMYICYPVLEGLVKFVMSRLIDPDGNVLEEFSDGKTSCKPGDRVSNLAILLRSLEHNASSLLLKPDLGIDLKDFRNQIEQLVPREKQKHDGWDSIYRLRITSVHGVVGQQWLRIGLINNLICLIVWHFLGDAELSQALKEIETRPRMLGFLRGYYPPEL